MKIIKIIEFMRDSMTVFSFLIVLLSNSVNARIESWVRAITAYILFMCIVATQVQGDIVCSV